MSKSNLKKLSIQLPQSQVLEVLGYVERLEKALANLNEGNYYRLLSRPDWATEFKHIILTALASKPSFLKGE